MSHGWRGIAMIPVDSEHEGDEDELYRNSLGEPAREVLMDIEIHH